MNASLADALTLSQHVQRALVHRSLEGLRIVRIHLRQCRLTGSAPSGARRQIVGALLGVIDLREGLAPDGVVLLQERIKGLVEDLSIARQVGASEIGIRANDTSDLVTEQLHVVGARGQAGLLRQLTEPRVFVLDVPVVALHLHALGRLARLLVALRERRSNAREVHEPGELLVARHQIPERVASGIPALRKRFRRLLPGEQRLEGLLIRLSERLVVSDALLVRALALLVGALPLRARVIDFLETPIGNVLARETITRR